MYVFVFFFSSRRRHTRYWRDWSSDVCSSDLHLFADCVRTIREVPDEEAEEYLSEKSLYFRGFLAWMTFPPMILLTFGQPVALVIVYASLGALFLPFLATTLLLLLNSRRVAPEYRNRIVTNVILAASVIPFVVVGVQEVLGSL